MRMKSLLVIASTVVLGATVAYASFVNPRVPVEFYKGHTHENGQTIGAPEHSGGTDSFGCHNGSVPYHCH